MEAGLCQTSKDDTRHYIHKGQIFFTKIGFEYKALSSTQRLNCISASLYIVVDEVKFYYVKTPCLYSMSCSKKVNSDRQDVP